MGPALSHRVFASKQVETPEAGAQSSARAGLPALCGAGRAVVAPLVVLSVLTAVSSMTWIAGLKYSDVVVATVLSSTSPIFALVLGAMSLGERLTPAAVVGALLTVAGIVVLEV